MVHFASFHLTSFRCYDRAALERLTPGLVVLYGPNGAGKTNILEALSLFAPGRGLRSAKPMEIQNADMRDPWAASAVIQTDYGPLQAGTGLDPASEKRTIRIEGQTVRSQTQLAEHLALLWLTPQMDRLFLDSARERRKFLDRMIFAFDPGHAGRLTRYDNALSQRSRLLKEGTHDHAWLSGLEAQMAETGVSIAAARLDFVERLNASRQGNQEGGSLNAGFPDGYLRAAGTVEELLQNAPALEVEELFRYQLEQSRPLDATAGGAATGPHKSDLAVTYIEKNRPADQCSTGEQKALLIGIILAHARLLRAERGFVPVLLFDEVAAHLDEGRRADLYAVLQGLGGQVWLTGTDRALFSSIEGQAQFFEIMNSSVHPV